MSDINQTTECAYCGYEVSHGEETPATDDDDRWTELAKQHAEDCEWIRTRAHRRSEEE